MPQTALPSELVRQSWYRSIQPAKWRVLSGPGSALGNPMQHRDHLPYLIQRTTSLTGCRFVNGKMLRHVMAAPGRKSLGLIIARHTAPQGGSPASQYQAATHPGHRRRKTYWSKASCRQQCRRCLLSDIQCHCKAARCTSSLPAQNLKHVMPSENAMVALSSSSSVTPSVTPLAGERRRRPLSSASVKAAMCTRGLPPSKYKPMMPSQ